MEAMDRERQRIGQKFGIDLISIQDWLYVTYHVEGSNVFEAMRNTPAYEGVLGPASLNNRYIFEDLPTGLVPMTMLGRAVGVPTPVMDAVVTLTGAMTGIDYIKSGRTLEKLGLENKSIEEIICLIS